VPLGASDGDIDVLHSPGEPFVVDLPEPEEVRDDEGSHEGDPEEVGLRVLVEPIEHAFDGSVF
jgi:hypothetical protein